MSSFFLTHIVSEAAKTFGKSHYAGAREAIFGPTEQLLESVHAAAKANPIRVDLYRPKPPNMYIFERIEGEEKPSKVTRIPGPCEIKIRRSKRD